ncbi:MAG TPA: ABC transporter permease [Vicinamibacterales bacterium]|jgi:putative ABC transport system permease protein|nr:ABC transporter permease [Vicinamibacterales bacterium]
MQDLRLAFRNLWRRPAFSAIAIVTLALGLGANAAVFTVSNAILLAPLPYTRPNDVVILTEQTPQFPSVSVTIYNYEDWRDRAKSFSAMAAFRPTNMTVLGVGDPERVAAKMITASLLPLLGVTIEHGRNFTAADDRPGAEGVVILGDGYARRRFAGQNPVGQVLQLDNRPFTVVGMMPSNFELFQPADIYVPFGPWAATLPEDRGWHPGIFPIARLKDGSTIEQARTEMDAISAQLEAEYPESNKNVRALVNPAQEQLVKNIRPAILLLTGAVVLVLLIACANVANLLLARAVDRQKEIAVRIALGAGRLRIVRQLMIESILLSCVGAAAGLLITGWVISFLTNSAAAALPRMHTVAIEWRVILFAFALAIVTGIVFGLAPALYATRTPIRASLNEESRGGSGSARQRKLHSSLVVVEIGLALVLLVGAGLLLRSFTRLTNVPPGFNADNLLIVNLPLSPQKYHDDVSRTSVVEEITARVRRLPGVKAAAMTTMIPMAGSGAMIHFNRAAYPPKGPDDYVMAGYRAVMPGYLETLGVPLRRGRMITDRDYNAAPRVVVINESMARQYFPDRDPLGQRIQIGTEPSPELPTMEIVGIVGDVKQSFEAGSNAEMFVPYGQYPDPILAPMYLNTALVVRASGEPLDLTNSLRAAILEIDPGQPLVNVRTMEMAMAGTVAQPRFQMILLMVFASIAVALAAIGVYGIMAYTVSQRTPEIGVRMAVGASPNRVVRMVVWQGARLAVMGVVLGMIAAALAAGAMQTLLFDIKGIDPLTFAAAPVFLGIAAILASYIPARRAARISPLAALGR